jgi:activator of 2-hydroxyglutaryl-CoA dehydratase
LPFNSAFRTPHSAFRSFRNPQSAIRNQGVAVMRVGVDVGGTFTDLVALAQDGTLHVRKVLSTPEDPAVGLFQAVDELCGERGALKDFLTVAGSGRRLWGRVTASDGAVQLTASAPLDDRDPVAAGEEVARLLIAQGAEKFLAR